MRLIKSNLVRQYFTSVVIALLCVSMVRTQQMTNPAVQYGGIMSGYGSTATATATLYGAQLFGSLTGTPTAAATYTTDTAANICSMLPVNGQTSPVYGWVWYIRNTAGGAFTITMAGGTGVTMNSTSLTIPQNDFKVFYVTVSSCAAGSQAIVMNAAGAAAAF